MSRASRVACTTVVALPVVLAGCPQFLSDWEIAVGGGAGDDAHTSAEAAVDAGADSSADASADADVEAGPACITDLSNVGTGDFHVYFTLATTSAQNMAVLNQRAACSPSVFWDAIASAGKIAIETDDGTVNGDINLHSTSTINDGSPHAIVIARKSGTISITIDGSANGSFTDGVSFGALPALQQGTDVCVGINGLQDLAGTLTGVCLTRP